MLTPPLGKNRYRDSPGGDKTPGLEPPLGGGITFQDAKGPGRRDPRRPHRINNNRPTGTNIRGPQGENGPSRRRREKNGEGTPRGNLWCSHQHLGRPTEPTGKMGDKRVPLKLPTDILSVTKEVEPWRKGGKTRHPGGVRSGRGAGKKIIKGQEQRGTHHKKMNTGGRRFQRQRGAAAFGSA